MPKIKLTQLAAEHLQPLTNAVNVTYWDTQLPGFGLRVSAKGRKTFVAMYRVKGGKEVMETIATMAELPDIKDARDRARASMLQARQGINPVVKRKAAEAGMFD